MVAAETQDGVAAWKLASNAMARSYSLGVEPIPQLKGPHVDAISDHIIGNVGQAPTSEKAISRPLFADDLQNDSLRPASVPLSVEHSLPRAEVEITFGDRDDHFVTDGQVS